MDDRESWRAYHPSPALVIPELWRIPGGHGRRGGHYHVESVPRTRQGWACWCVAPAPSLAGATSRRPHQSRKEFLLVRCDSGRLHLSNSVSRTSCARRPLASRRLRARCVACRSQEPCILDCRPYRTRCKPAPLCVSCNAEWASDTHAREVP